MPWGNDGIEKVKIKKIQDLYVCPDFFDFHFYFVSYAIF